MSEEAVNSQRVTPDQRRTMLDFMKAHPALAFNRFTAPNGAQHKQTLLNDLTIKLNSSSTGATKTSDKWLKSWQDWRSDTKSKASKIRKSRNGTGGGPPCKLVLSQIEEELLEVMGPVAVEGLGVLDPLLAEDQVVLQQDQQQDQIVVDVQDGIAGEQGSDFILLVQETAATPSHSISGSTPAAKRRRTHLSSTESEQQAEEKIINCSEESLHVQKEQLKLQQQQVQLLQEQLKVQKEHGDKMEAIFSRVADAVIGGIHSYQQYLDYLKEK